MRKGDIADPGRFVDGKVPMAPAEPPQGEPVTDQAPAEQPKPKKKKKAKA